MSKIRCRLVIILSFLLTIAAIQLNAEETTQWPEFGKWYQWKKQSNLNKRQKDVIQYLEAATALYNKASETESVQAESKYGYPDPNEAIVIVEKTLNEFKNIPFPKECMKYRESSIKLMKYILAYHKLRLKYKEGSDEFETMHNRFVISEIKSGYGSMQFSEYFKSMREVGLFDNILDEMANLGLISKKNLEDFYYYSQEMDISIALKCPKCSTVMRKVPIIYGNVTERQIYDKDRKIIALPAGDIPAYQGRPLFAYICDKDNKWYEEYPSHNKGKIIIRNWGWGFYDWRYGKKR